MASNVTEIDSNSLGLIEQALECAHQSLTNDISQQSSSSSSTTTTTTTAAGNTSPPSRPRPPPPHHRLSASRSASLCLPPGTAQIPLPQISPLSSPFPRSQSHPSSCLSTPTTKKRQRDVLSPTASTTTDTNNSSPVTQMTSNTSNTHSNTSAISVLSACSDSEASELCSQIEAQQTLVQQLLFNNNNLQTMFLKTYAKLQRYEQSKHLSKAQLEQQLNEIEQHKEAEIANVQRRMSQIQSILHSLERYKVGDHIEHLSKDELKTLELICLNNLKRINDAKGQRVMDTKMCCIVCLRRKKNVVILGCNHLVLCEECEQKASPKHCPQCKKPYIHVIKLN